MLEGVVCLFFASPIMLVFSMLGGITARILWGRFARRSPGIVSAYALPLLLIAIESQIPSPYEIRTVNTEILIHAPSQTVWDNIKSVRAIAPEELSPSWINRYRLPASWLQRSRTKASAASARPASPRRPRLY